MYSPSYISFFSALYHHSIIFQYENDIYLAYKKSDVRKVLDFEIKLKNLKKEILLNPS
jgi:predicted transcriptional regulator of viral defense system